jgi:hypothetical protein
MTKFKIRSVTRTWVLLSLVVAGSIGVLAGLVYMVAVTLFGSGTDVSPAQAKSSPSSTSSTAPAGTSAQDPIALRKKEDALATKPMVQLLPSAAQPQPLVTTTAGPPIILPEATVLTELVPTGFPRTPQGAVAQLAMIDEAALRNLSRQQVQLVYGWAVMPGAVSQQTWNMSTGFDTALARAGLTDSASALQLSYTVTGAQVKGTLDGGDFVVACVLGEIDGNYRNSTRFGAGDCQRMVWATGRWRIGPGPQPAFAPSAWPGSADSVRAGWREAQQHD